MRSYWTPYLLGLGGVGRGDYGQVEIGSEVAWQGPVGSGHSGGLTS